MNGTQFGVVLVAFLLALVPATGATAGTATQDDHAAIQDEPQPRDDAPFEPVLLTDETLSLDGGTLTVETGLLTLRNGTLALTAKRSVLTAGGDSTTVSNVQLALGDGITPAEAERVRNGVERGELVIPRGISYARVAVGSLSVRADGTLVNETDLRQSVGQRSVPTGGEVAGPREPGFEVTNLDAPGSAPVGESYNVSARVTNPANVNGTEVLQYRFGGVVVQQETVGLDAGESRTVTFSADPGSTPSDPGTYTHGVYAFSTNRTAQITLTNGGNATSGGNATDGGNASVAASGA